ncbi:MAG: dTMP kinase [Acutalibacteraceae bacterium]
MAGKLIVIEGLDGSGKATQTNLLYERLKKEGKNVIRLSFPVYESESSALVRMYLGGELAENPNDVNAYTASAFYAVDRVASFIKDWKKDYEQGAIFLCDRYTTSNAVFQLAKMPKEKYDDFLSWLFDFEYVKLGVPSPDKVIYLDMPTEVSQKLLSKRYNGKEEKKDLHEKNEDFLKCCRDSAMYCAEKLSWHKIYCAKNGEPKPIYEIANDIYEAVKGSI